MKTVLGLTFAAAAQAVRLQSDENDGIWWTPDISYGAYGDYLAPANIIDRTGYPIEYFTLESVTEIGSLIDANLLDHAGQDADDHNEILDAMRGAREALAAANVKRQEAWAELEDEAFSVFAQMLSDENENFASWGTAVEPAAEPVAEAVADETITGTE